MKKSGLIGLAAKYNNYNYYTYYTFAHKMNPEQKLRNERVVANCYSGGFSEEKTARKFTNEYY